MYFLPHSGGSVDELTGAPPTFGTPWYLYICLAIVRIGNPNPKLHYNRVFRAKLGLLLAAFSTLALNN